MGRSEGSAHASDDMKRCVALVLTFLVTGCSHTSVQMSSAGTTTTTAGASVSIGGSGGSAVWPLIGIGLIAAQFAGRRIEESALPAVESGPAPALDDSRRVNVQDCSKPIGDWSANLKCR